jgi:hypothetical protein
MKPLILLTLICSGPILGLNEGSRLWATQTAQEGKGCSAPKEWGQLKGVSDRAIAFEDASGTIRVLDVGPCMRGQTQLIVKINRQ